LRQLDEALRIMKKLAPSSPENKRFYEQLLQERERFAKEMKGSGNPAGKTLLQKVVPDTPTKMALWAAVLAGAAGLVTYAVLKKRD